MRSCTTAACRIATSRSSIRPARCRVFVAAGAVRRLRGGVRVGDGGLRRRARARRRSRPAPRPRSSSPSSPVLVGSLILTRFDLWPALLATAALAALVAERHRLGWALLGAAVAAKLWPLVLVPLALVWSIRARTWLGRRSSVPRSRRPLRCPSSCSHRTGSGRASAARLRGRSRSRASARRSSPRSAARSVITSHGSQNIAGHGALAALFAVAAVRRAAWRSGSPSRAGRRRANGSSATPPPAVCAFIAFGKVLSPQFLIWLVPLVPLVRGRRGVAAAVLLTAALVLTQVWFPRRYWSYVGAFHLAGVVLARNLALVALLVVLVLRSSGPTTASPRAELADFDADGLACGRAAVRRHSTSAPSIRTSPVAGSSRVGMPVRKRFDRVLLLASDHRIVRAGHVPAGPHCRLSQGSEPVLNDDSPLHGSLSTIQSSGRLRVPAQI